VFIWDEVDGRQYRKPLCIVWALFCVVCAVIALLFVCQHCAQWLHRTTKTTVSKVEIRRQRRRPVLRVYRVTVPKCGACTRLCPSAPSPSLTLTYLWNSLMSSILDIKRLRHWLDSPEEDGQLFACCVHQLRQHMRSHKMNFFKINCYKQTSVSETIRKLPFAPKQHYENKNYVLWNVGVCPIAKILWKTASPSCRILLKSGCGVMSKIRFSV